MRIRRKCDWYEYGPQHFFLILKNLEQHKAQFELLQKIKKPYSPKRINRELFDFCRGLFSENLNVSKNKIMQFLNLVSIPQLTKY